MTLLAVLFSSDSCVEVCSIISMSIFSSDARSSIGLLATARDVPIFARHYLALLAVHRKTPIVCHAQARLSNQEKGYPSASARILRPGNKESARRREHFCVQASHV